MLSPESMADLVPVIAVHKLIHQVITQLKVKMFITSSLNTRISPL